MAAISPLALTPIMLDLFRKNLFVYNLFLLIYCIILRISWFFLEIPQSHLHDGVLSTYLFNLMGDDTIFIKIFAIVILIYQAIQINRLVSLNRLTNENTLFSGLFYLLIISVTLSFIPLHASLLANTFLIVMLTDIFKQTKNHALHLNIFNVGFWAGMASLLYFPYILFFPVGVLGVIYLRTFKSIDFFRAFLGLLVPYFLMATALFLTDDLSRLWSDHALGAFGFLNISDDFAWKDYTLLGIFAIIILISLATMGNFATGVNIHVRRKISVIFFTLIGALLLMVIVANTSMLSLIFLSVPLSIFMAMMFLKLEPQFAELIHFILFALAIAFQYLV